MEMVEHHQSTRKTIRYTDKEENRISELPDCLLIDIISRLPTTKEAIRTATLSKRWQHLWPYVSNLIIIDNNYYAASQTLTQCCQSNLHKFQISAYYPQVNNWIRYAVSRNVQDLNLSLASEFVLDEFMFTISCFTHLTLNRCVFNPTGAISWSNLKSLSLSWLHDLTEDSIQNILSGSPLLETFELKDCFGFRRIDITSKSVKNFMFTGFQDYGMDDIYEENNYYEDSDDIIEINAPYIVSLTITYHMRLTKILLVDVSCLVKADLNYEYYGGFKDKVSYAENLKGLILSLRHVKELKIEEPCLKVLSRLEDKGVTFPSNSEHPDKWPDYDPSESVDWSDNDSTETGDQ